MLYYHGTTKFAADAIQREGLNPHREYEYAIENEFGVGKEGWVGEDKENIYVTPFKNLAMIYADFRARYVLAKTGDFIPWGFSGGGFFKRKAKPFKGDPTPVVLTFDVPIRIARQFEDDMQDILAKVCKCYIPARYITDLYFVKPGDVERENEAVIRQYADSLIR